MRTSFMTATNIIKTVIPSISKQVPTAVVGREDENSHCLNA
jgi:hypothetical protein